MDPPQADTTENMGESSKFSTTSSSGMGSDHYMRSMFNPHTMSGNAGDPDGNYVSEEESSKSSRHGESLQPTRQDSFSDEMVEVDDDVGVSRGDIVADSTDDDEDYDSEENEDYYESGGELNSVKQNTDSGRSGRSGMQQSYESGMSGDSFVGERHSGRFSNPRFKRPSVQEHSQNDDVESALASTFGLFRNMGMMVSARSFKPSSKTNFAPNNGFHKMQTLEDEEDEDLQSPRSNASSFKGPKHDPYPGAGILVFLAVLIALIAGVLVGGLTWYIWDKERLDPIRPPGYTDPNSPTDGGGNFGGSTNSDMDLKGLLPSDAVLTALFAQVVPLNAFDANAPSRKALNWMLFEDTGKTDLELLPRSEEAWIQRFVLAYTYFSTTTIMVNDTQVDTLWLSCNPPVAGGGDECRFSYPTELPTGRVIYDLVPSHRWLSGTDECLWGGVACGKTVIEKLSSDPNKLQFEQEQRRSAITSIVLADQNLQGSIVTELASLPHLETLDFSHNGLKGQLGEEFHNLHTLRLQHNELTGTLPPEFFNASSGISPLVELNLGSNNLIGSIPAEMGLSTTLQFVSLSDNNLGGSIPILGNMPLEVFRVDNNGLKGVLPFDYMYGRSWPGTLKEWWIHNNKLSGSLPEGIGFLTSLEDFRVNHNKFTGTVPESIGNLNRLYRFEAHSNQLEGTIPESIGGLSSLQNFKVQFNSLSGVMPQELCFLETMENLEANCFFNEEEAREARAKRAQDERAKAKAAQEELDTNDDGIPVAVNENVRVEAIPVFNSLTDAVAAARAQEKSKSPPAATIGAQLTVPASRPPQPSGPISSSSGPSDEVQCYCCTRCCDQKTGECLRFSTNTITSNSHLITSTESSIPSKKSLRRFSVSSIGV